MPEAAHSMPKFFYIHHAYIKLLADEVSESLRPLDGVLGPSGMFGRTKSLPVIML